MIRTIVTPQNTDLHLSIPIKYVGKQIEVLVYTTDEVDVPNNIGSASQLRGKLQLSSEESKEFHQYLNESRSEWSKDI